MRHAAQPALRALALLALLGLAACGGSSGAPSAAYEPGKPYPGIDCAPFARELSGIALYGDAASWWDQAAGRYRRGSQPILGAALVFRREGRLPSGHVSVVSRLIGPRQIQVTQANWVHGELNQDQLVIDVSERNDWSAVRVWWPPVGQLGAHEYATYGFILPTTPATHDELAHAASLAAQLALSSNFGRPPPRARELSRSAM
jgi:surface antigen